MSAATPSNGEEKNSGEMTHLLAEPSEQVPTDPPESSSHDNGVAPEPKVEVMDGMNEELKDQPIEESNSSVQNGETLKETEESNNFASNPQETNQEEEEEEEEDETTGKSENSNAPNASEDEEIDSVTGEKRKRGNDDDWKPSSPGNPQTPPGKKKLKKANNKKKPKVKKVPEVGLSEGEKMSFQEAAVQVLGEQREKGVYALSTRRIWELISQSGLVDTKCKTPVSSLSSRITEDVRTKGNKSVFVRVGEGLYTLRKGLKKQEIERYLNAKYPNMAHGSDLDHQFSEEEPEESNSPVQPPSEPQSNPLASVSNANANNLTANSSTSPPLPSNASNFQDQFSKLLQENEVKKNNVIPRSIPVRLTKPPINNSSNSSSNSGPVVHGNAAAAAAHYASIAASKLQSNPGLNGVKNVKVEVSKKIPELKNATPKKPEPPKIKLKEIKWVGLPLKKKKNGDIHYSSVQVENSTFRIGDCVYFEPSSDPDQSKEKSGSLLNYIGRITKLFQTNSKAIMKAHGGTMLVECVWYYYPEDTKTGRRKKHHKQEIFLSELTDVNNVNTIKSPVQVLSFHQYDQFINAPERKDNEEHPKDVFFCRSFYNDSSQTFHSLQFDHNNGSFHFNGLNSSLDPPNIVKNWPKEIEWTPSLLWGEISEVVKELLDTKHKPYVTVLPLKSEEGNNNNSQASLHQNFALYASTWVQEGAILGDFQGMVINNTEESSSHHDPVGLIRTLYEDHELLISIDATETGNEFRFMRDVSVSKTPANVKLSSVYLDSKWLLLVQTLRAISKGEEIVVDLSESSMPDLEGFLEESGGISSPEHVVLSSTRHNLIENERSNVAFNFDDPPKLVKPKRVPKSEEEREEREDAMDIKEDSEEENAHDSKVSSKAEDAIPLSKEGIKEEQESNEENRNESNENKKEETVAVFTLKQEEEKMQIETKPKENENQPQENEQNTENMEVDSEEAKQKENQQITTEESTEKRQD